MKFTRLIRIAALLLVLPLITAGSCSQTNARPKLPDAGIPVHTVTEKLVYVQIRDELTAHPAEIPSGPLADAPLVAKQRGAALKVCWANMDQIAAIAGTPVKPAAPAPMKGKP